MVIVLILLTIAAFLILDYYVQRRRVERVGEPGTIAAQAARDTADIVHVPCGTYMAPGHTWLRPEDDGAVRVGAGRVPLHALGALDNVQLLRRGSSVIEGDTIAVLVRGARTLRLVSPVEGVVDSVNTDLVRAPSRMVESPFGSGWLYTIRPRELAQALRRTFVAEEAEGFVRRELARLRDALSRPAEGAEPELALLDGGVPLEGFAERLSEAQWTSVSRTMFESPPAETEPDLGR